MSATYAYIFHEDGSVTELYNTPTYPQVAKALKQQMDGCQDLSIDVIVQEDDESTWTLIKGDTCSRAQGANIGLGGYLMHLEKSWYGKVALTRSSLTNPEKYETLEPLPKSTLEIYEHLSAFRDDWRAVHKLPPCK